MTCSLVQFTTKRYYIFCSRLLEWDWLTVSTLKNKLHRKIKLNYAANKIIEVPVSPGRSPNTLPNQSFIALPVGLLEVIQPVLSRSTQSVQGHSELKKTFCFILCAHTCFYLWHMQPIIKLKSSQSCADIGTHPYRFPTVWFEIAKRRQLPQYSK